MEKSINSNQRGRLRWEKLKEAGQRGTLQYAKNRYELANMAGFADAQRTRGYQWVSGMIKRGHIQEVFEEVDKYGKFKYLYYLVSDPDYDRKKARAAWSKKAKQARKNNTVKPIEIPTEKVEEKVAVVVEKPTASGSVYKLEFTRGDMSIKVELDDYDKVVGLIKTFMKGE